MIKRKSKKGEQIVYLFLLKKIKTYYIISARDFMEEINLTDLLKYFISKILIIILITIFCGLLGSVYALFIQNRTHAYMS